MKSICIKTNNSNLIQYLLNELRHIDLNNICFSLQEFKHYKNIIIHYKGSNINDFLRQISSILSLMVIDELEEHFINTILIQNYFYFDNTERKEILNFCFDIMTDNFSVIFDKKFRILYNSFYNYLTNNRSLYINGFIHFRLKQYFLSLDKVVDEAVNNFIIQKEYLEFISLLKLYINSRSPDCNVVHLIYSNTENLLLNEQKEIINISDNNLTAKYLSDISFSTNDYILNSLLTLLPQKIYIHFINSYPDEFINTLTSIFENRVTFCTDCNICNLYKNEIQSKTSATKNK